MADLHSLAGWNNGRLIKIIEQKQKFHHQNINLQLFKELYVIFQAKKQNTT